VDKNRIGGELRSPPRAKGNDYICYVYQDLLKIYGCKQADILYILYIGIRVHSILGMATSVPVEAEAERRKTEVPYMPADIPRALESKMGLCLCGAPSTVG